MNVSDFDFELPEHLIAQKPLQNRSGSRLLSVNKSKGQLSHHQFSDIMDFLESGDCLVLNNTRVLPARLFGVKRDTGAKTEVLLIHELQSDQWDCLVKPAKRIKSGAMIDFYDVDGDQNAEPICSAEVLDEKEMGGRVIRFHYEGMFLPLLERIGSMPLPPYIKEKLNDQERYQTVYAERNGSAAAPTAGLHFTPQLLEQIQQKGITIAYVTLHVGIGTFRPVSAEKVEDHKMHAEYYEITEENTQLMNHAKRIIAVGTTSARTLETASSKSSDQQIEAGSGWTDIFIYPGYRFKAVDALLTNFHLPKSSLLMMISALAGKQLIEQAYEEAIREGYRFFSFGDAMFIH